MAQLTVRGVDDAIAAALKARAAKAGRSAEAEHRRILEEALAPAAGEAFFERARACRIRLKDADTLGIIWEDRGRS